jgi:predicted RNA binding protein YcfA (HicA-like mRNA interferase family)
MNKHKLLKKVLGGSKNIRFGDLVTLVEAFGFQQMRVNGSHHIFQRPGVAEIINLQDRNGKAIPYQVKQFLELIEQYNLQLGDDG